MSETNAPIPKPGDTAPDFTLASTAGNTVTLSAFRNEKNVLLAFFPLAFTSTCTAEMCSFSEDFDQFTGKGVEVLPISVDAIPSLKEYKKAYSFKVDLLSDFKRVASRAYGVLNPERFYSNRSYFLIDKAGSIRWAYVEDHNGLHRSSADLLAQIEKLGD
ncbi:MAG: redoxin domain-containing protein [Gemmatimonas sp.]